jgi:hypothetical protein
MKNNKIWRVEKMEFISDDSENKDHDIDKSKIDDDEDDDLLRIDK